MAKRKVNKSQKIREYVAEHPEAGPSQVARDLKQFGVTPALVSNVKARGDAPPRRRKKRVRRKRSLNRNGMPRRRRRDIQPIVAAAELIRLCGGIEEAKSALDTAGRIASVLR